MEREFLQGDRPRRIPLSFLRRRRLWTYRRHKTDQLRDGEGALSREGRTREEALTTGRVFLPQRRIGKNPIRMCDGDHAFGFILALVLFIRVILFLRNISDAVPDEPERGNIR